MYYIFGNQIMPKNIVQVVVQVTYNIYIIYSVNIEQYINFSIAHLIAQNWTQNTYI